MSFPLFDWLRFLLASVVVLGHAEVIGWGPAGNFAVQVFFALSGWLIGGILLRSSREDLPRFYFNRATRIWIPYLFAVATIYALGYVRDQSSANFPAFLFYDLTFTHNWFIPKVPEVTATMPLKGTGTHFWSISVEEQFYLLAPLLIYFVRWGRSVALWLLVAIASYFLSSWYASISLGVLAAVAQHRHGDWHLNLRWLFATVIGLCGVAVVASPSLYPALAPFAAIAIVLVTAVPGPRRGFAEFLGGVSYPLYLYHWIGVFAANLLARHIELPALASGWLAYIVAVVIGAGAYVAIDRNVMRWRARGYSPRRGVAITVTAYTLLITGVVGGLFLVEIAPAGSSAGPVEQVHEGSGRPIDAQ